MRRRQGNLIKPPLPANANTCFGSAAAAGCRRHRLLLVG
jgi:hypothetical protein